MIQDVKQSGRTEKRNKWFKEQQKAKAQQLEDKIQSYYQAKWNDFIPIKETVQSMLNFKLPLKKSATVPEEQILPQESPDVEEARLTVRRAIEKNKAELIDVDLDEMVESPDMRDTDTYAFEGEVSH